MAGAGSFSRLRKLVYRNGLKTVVITHRKQTTEEAVTGPFSGDVICAGLIQDTAYSGERGNSPRGRYVFSINTEASMGTQFRLRYFST